MNAQAERCPLLPAFLISVLLALAGLAVSNSAAQATETETLSPGTPEQLTVIKAGNGSGTVTSDPAGIDCGSDCEEWYSTNERVTLTATPDPGSVFVGWDPGGGPGCPGTDPCSLLMATDKTVTSTFRKLEKYELTVTRSGTGTGKVLSDIPGIDCGSDCSENYQEGTIVTLSTDADPDSTFEGWSGAGCGTDPLCIVTMDQARSVDAIFSVKPQYELTVTRSGAGDGSVTSDPSGIDCGSDCSEEFTEDTMVTLTATPETGSTFEGWTGAGCSGTGTCVVTMDEAKSVDAEFALIPPDMYRLDVTKSGTGEGSVGSDPTGIECGSDCSEEFTEDTMVTLTATPETGSTFEGWTGAGCSGTGTCVVTMDEAKSVDAEFALIPPKGFELSVTKAGTGTGTVSSTPEGIDCGSDCSEEFEEGTEVTLVATPDSGSSFAGWMGAGCSGTDPCVVTMDEAKEVEAYFNRDPGPPTYLLSVVKSGPGEGRVTASPGDIDCGPLCSEEFEEGTVVTLTATAANGDVFTGWSGPCEDGNPCIVTMDESKTVTANFDGPPPSEYLVSVAKNGNGQGDVVSDPNGIDCGERCAEIYPEGTVVDLEAKPDFASTFEGWAGSPCQVEDGTNCILEVDERKDVDALFQAKPGGGVWARKVREGLNTVPRSRVMRSVKGICKRGKCQIRRIRAQVVIRGRKFGQIPTKWSRKQFRKGQTRVVRAIFPRRIWRRLETRKCGQLIVQVGITSADGRRVVTRGIRIGIRR